MAPSNANYNEAHEGGLPSTDRSLLVVDDDEILCQRLAGAMTNRGFDVTAATSVGAGLRAIADAPPAFAIFDMKAGDGNGIDLMSSLREHRADARAIMLTGYGNLRTAVAAVAIGAFDYLAKPADADEIYNALVAVQHDQAALPDHPLTADDVRIGHIWATYEDCDRNVSQTARRLNLHRRTLQRILARHSNIVGHGNPTLAGGLNPTCYSVCDPEHRHSVHG